MKAGIDPIGHNLVELYQAVAGIGNYSLLDSPPFRCISEPSLTWPELVFIPGEADSITRESIAQLTDRIGVDHWPRTFITGERLLSPEVQAELKSAGFFPVAQWTNMALKGDEASGHIGPAGLNDKDIVVRKVKNKEELTDWMGIVEKVLFSGRKLSADIFEKGIQTGIFNLFTAYYKGRPASTALIFRGENAGVYMVATGLEHRRLGIAGFLMRSVQEMAFASGYEVLFLHSTKDGLEFYKSLGYTPLTRMILYYLRK